MKKVEKFLQSIRSHGQVGTVTSPPKKTGAVVHCRYMGVAKHRGTPKSSLFNRIFHYKPSIFRYPYFWRCVRCCRSNYLVRIGVRCHVWDRGFSSNKLNSNLIHSFLHNLQQISGMNPLIDYGAWQHAWGDRKLTSHGKSNLNFSKTNPKGQSGALFGKPASVRFLFTFYLFYLDKAP